MTSATCGLVRSGNCSGSGVPRASSVTRFVSTPKPAPSSFASLSTMRSSALASSFRFAFSIRSSVSSAKPTTTAPSRRASRVLFRMSAFSSSSIARACPVFFSLLVAASAGR